MKKSAKVLIATKVEEMMQKKLTVIAMRTNVGMPDVVRAAFAAHIAAHEKQHGKISAEELNQLGLFDE